MTKMDILNHFVELAFFIIIGLTFYLLFFYFCELPKNMALALSIISAIIFMNYMKVREAINELKE